MAALADLHRHLDGSLRPSTVTELAAELGVTVPADLRFTPGMGLDGALARFELTLSLLQTPSALRRVAAEMCEDAAADDVTTLEIRFAPHLHRLALEVTVDAVLEGIAGRAGLILCGLYGDDPALVMRLVELASTRDGIVGIDLAGGPTLSHSFSLLDYAPAYQRARELGLGRTVHAGEGRPPGEIRVAVEQLAAQRIGHGTTLLDDLAVTELVIARQVTIEACPTSNVHTGVIGAVAEHPLPRWLERGVRVCVCTDNTLFSDVTESQELARVAAIPGMNRDRLAQLIDVGHAAAFRR